jgi:hypothetical protein
MKFLAQLEKKTFVWSLIALCFVFIILRLPSIIEPYWYGDEGIYEVIGQAMNHGHLLYRDIWDNKPPLLYVVYALANGDQPTVKILSLIVGLLSVIAFFFLSQKLFNRQKISIITTSLFVLLFATPILEANIANAEDFILLPIILAGLLIYNFVKPNKKPNFSFLTSHFSLLIAGLLLGLAFMFKIVAVFDLIAFLLFFVILNLPANLTWKTVKKNTQPLIRNSLFVILGFLLPFLLTILYFAFNNALSDFSQSALVGNVGYVGWKNNLLGIPQGLLIIKFVALVIIVALIIKKRKHFSPSVLFILLWFIFSLFNVYFSGRPYTHYAIVLLPSFCLFVGLFFTNVALKNKIITFITVLILAGILSFHFGFNLSRSYAYYQNVLQFLIGQKSIEAYQSFFDQKVPRDYTIATFISSHTTAQDVVFVWGNNPQIYALSHKIPPGKYTVAYHVSQNNAFDETQHALNKTQPKYIIVLTESAPLPFVIPLYIMRYNLSGATIYERSF